MLLFNKNSFIKENQQIETITKKISDNHYLSDDSVSLNDKISFIHKNYFDNHTILSQEEFIMIMDKLILFANKVRITDEILLKISLEMKLDFESMFLFFYKNSISLSAYYNEHKSSKKVRKMIHYLFGNSLGEYLSNKIQKGVFHKQINNHILFSISKQHLNTFVTLNFDLRKGIHLYQSYDFSFFTDFAISLFKMIDNEPLKFNQKITTKEIKYNAIHKMLVGLLNFSEYGKSVFEDYSQQVLRYEQHLTPNLFLSFKQKTPIVLDNTNEVLTSLIKKVDYHLAVLVMKTSDFYYNTSYSYYQYHEMGKVYEGLVNNKFNLWFTLKYILIKSHSINRQQKKYNENEYSIDERIIIRKFFKLLSNFNIDFDEK